MALFSRYGYKKYKMSKFEEYDLYLENKSFLKSENIIAFNDISGKLMALKPDVTLSIAKNTEAVEKGTKKLYYAEKVYRVSGGVKEFREIEQIGLELIGEVDLYSMAEVLLLAKRSLGVISGDFVLDVSHMGLVLGLLDYAEVAYSVREEITALIATKNTADIRRVARREGIDEDITDKLCRLSSLYGSAEKVLEAAKELIVNEMTAAAVKELSSLISLFKNCKEDGRINIDFSVVSDITYYNGITFRGYVQGVPHCVLSGGRYDNLLIKMGKNKSAVGFAVYTDMLSYLDKEDDGFDADVWISYTENTPAEDILKMAEEIISSGETVRVAPYSDNVKCRRQIALGGEEE